MDVVDEQQEGDQRLSRILQAEFAGLLDGIDGVGAGIGEPDHFRLRSLRLQQQRREIRCAERMAARAQHLATMSLDVIGGFRFDALAERVIHRQEIPVGAATLHHRRGGGVAGGPRIVDPLNGVGRAILAGQIRARGGGGEKRHRRPAQQRVDAETDRGVRHVDHRIDLVDVDPLADDRGADVGLVLMVGVDDLDLDILAAAVEVLGGHTGRFHRPHAIGVLEDAGNIIENADANDGVRDLRMRRCPSGARHGECEAAVHKAAVQDFHINLPLGDDVSSSVLPIFFVVRIVRWCG